MDSLRCDCSSRSEWEQVIDNHVAGNTWLRSMRSVRVLGRTVTLGVLASPYLGVMLTVTPALASIPPAHSVRARQEAQRLDRLPPLHGRTRIDGSGRKEKGRASWYGPGFAHHLMADGRHMNPRSNIAASKTLPLGTTARVVNLRNGKAATVRIVDRGPYIQGRVVDVSPKVAQELGMKTAGVVPVVVKPITVPQPDGQVKLGAGAAGLPLRQIERDTRTTKALVAEVGTETAFR